MTDEDLALAMADAKRAVTPAKSAHSIAVHAFKAADAGRANSAKALEEAEARRAEYFENLPKRLADAEAYNAAAKEEVRRLRDVLVEAVTVAERLTRKAGILGKAADYAEQGYAPASVAANAIDALVKHDALDLAEDETTAALRATGARQGAEAIAEFRQLATNEDTAAAQARVSAGMHAGAGAKSAKAALGRAEQEARSAEIALSNAKGGFSRFDRDVAAATEKADAERAKAYEAKAELDAAAAVLAEAQAHLAGLEDADAASAAKANADFTMFKVTIEHQAYGGDCDLSALGSDYEPLDVWGEGKNDDSGRVDVARNALGLAHDFLAGIGAVRCDDVAGDDSAAAVYWLPVKGAGWLPPGAAKGASNFVFAGYDVPLDGIRGARLKVSCIAEVVLPSDAYETIATRRVGQEVGYWGGEATPCRMLAPLKSRVSWLQGIGVWPEELDKQLKRLAKLNGNLVPYCSYIGQSRYEGVEWAVEGRLAFGTITLLVGDGEVGKSTLAQELCAAVNAEDGPKEWLGGKVSCRGVGAMVAGEEPEWRIVQRQERFARVWGHDAVGPVFCQSGPESMPQLLEWMAALPKYSVVTIDHASLFAGGDLTQSHIVTALLQPLNKLAKERQLSILLLHHFTKNAPRQAERMSAGIAGSVAFRNLVRMVLVLTRLDGGQKSITLNKSNIEGVWLDRNQSQIFREDELTHRLLPLAHAAAEPAAGGDDATVGAAILDLVFEQIARLNRTGTEVHKSGKNGLQALDLTELRSVGRNRLHYAIDALLAANRIARGPGGLIANVAA